MITKEELRILRNEVPINLIIADVLDIPWKVSEGYFRFLCPLCSEFNSSTNPKTNLASTGRRKSTYPPYAQRAFPLEAHLNGLAMVELK